MREPGHRQQAGEEADEDGDRVDQHQLLLLAAAARMIAGRDQRVDDDRRDRRVVLVRATKPRGEQAVLAVGPGRARAFSRPGPAWNDEAAAAKQQKSAGELEDAEQPAVPGCRVGELGDLGLVVRRNPDVEVNRERGQRQRQRRRRSRSSAPGCRVRSGAPAVVELAELRDRGGGRLRAGRQRHGDREGEDDRDERRTRRVGDRGAAVRRVWIDPAERQHRRPTR